jgi:hypothetical protein
VRLKGNKATDTRLASIRDVNAANVINIRPEPQATGNKWPATICRIGKLVKIIVMYKLNLMKGIIWTKIAIEIARLNKTLTEILILIQKEMKRSEEISKQYDLKERKERLNE